MTSEILPELAESQSLLLTGKYSLIKELLLLELQRNFWAKYTMIGS